VPSCCSKVLQSIGSTSPLPAPLRRLERLVLPMYDRPSLDWTSQRVASVCAHCVALDTGTPNRACSASRRESNQYASGCPRLHISERVLFKALAQCFSTFGAELRLCCCIYC